MSIGATGNNHTRLPKLSYVLNIPDNLIDGLKMSSFRDFLKNFSPFVPNNRVFKLNLPRGIIHHCSSYYVLTGFNEKAVNRFPICSTQACWRLRNVSFVQITVQLARAHSNCRMNYGNFPFSKIQFVKFWTVSV